VSEDERATEPVVEMPEPFLRWAGGKRWLAPVVREIYKDRAGRLVEPFVGSGAVFFALPSRDAILSDANADLINAYVVVRDQVEALINGLSRLAVSRETFLELRASQPPEPIARAVRFLYLNRTAFNGLYRVNRNGQYNVPYGCKPGTTTVNSEVLRACSEHLAGATLLGLDFRAALATCGPGDFVYLDPPYTVMHNQNGFNRYNEKLFSWDDQSRLAEEAVRLRALGATVVVSNADHKAVRALYPHDQFVAKRVERSSRMAASTAHRKQATEILFVSRRS
jgi:DNA adenine methylase